MVEDTEQAILDHKGMMDCPSCQICLDCSELSPLMAFSCPECEQALVVPGYIDAFRIEGRLGKGAMGEVFRGIDEKLERGVAIKVLQIRHAQNQKLTDGFLAEARSIAALNDPHIVQIHSLGEHRGHPYFVMELVDGEQMDICLWKEGVASERKTLEIARSVLKGLEVASAASLVHGDIKPANIMVLPNGSAKILDFGLARSAHTPGDAWGTPYYIAPERLLKKGEDHRADIYSLGATLFHILAGEPPFKEKTAKATAQKRLGEEAPDLREIRPDISEKTALMIARMLQKDRSQRYPTHASLLADLEAALSPFERSKGAGNKRGRVDTNASPMVLKLVAGSFALLMIACLGWGIWYLSSQAGKSAASKSALLEAQQKEALALSRRNARQERDLELLVEERLEEVQREEREREFTESLEEIKLDRGRYWINLNSMVRHNHQCRYFKNTANGRFGSKDEGRPCPACGG